MTTALFPAETWLRLCEVYPGTFRHPKWRTVRRLHPGLYADVRATWLTCLEIWARKARAHRRWNGLVSAVWLKRELPGCHEEINALIEAELLIDKMGILSMPYFPTKRGRSGVHGIPVFKVGLYPQPAPLP